jgi:phenylpyruvate tautomerase PptA (4-oxalocrotonate tautomerase family)
MPSYSVTIRNGDLDDEQKAAIARAITRAHGGVTGTPSYMAQVVFNEIEPHCYFLGGERLKERQIFVHGFTRLGRTRQTKDELIARLTSEVAAAAGSGGGSVWVYISEMPARQMVEFGRVLPAPGDEIAWNDAWSPSEKAHFATIGMSAVRH